VFHFLVLIFYVTFQFGPMWQIKLAIHWILSLHAYISYSIFISHIHVHIGSAG